MVPTEAKLKINAAESLASCLLEMAEAETNPVLQIINPDLPLEENKKYPPDLLQFNQTGWRAYYHCHPSTRTGNHRFVGEHGHFHIFVRNKKEPETWSHLVALAIDNMGQPLGWFTVNHWVTGEHWEETATLMNSLQKIPYSKQTSLIECWIMSLLALSNEHIFAVLQKRDEIIEQIRIRDNSQYSDIKQDKNLYLLSEVSINLQKLLNIF